MLLLIVLLFASCANKLDYSIKVKNVGTKPIWVNDFYINKKEKIGVGILPPKISSTTSSLRTEPDKRFPITWNDYQTKRIEVEMEIPTQFWKGRIHNGIIVNLNPDTVTAEIMYTAYSLEEDKDFRISQKEIQKP
jgi:hypothetical protein